MWRTIFYKWCLGNWLIFALWVLMACLLSAVLIFFILRRRREKRVASCPHFHPECGAATPVTPIFYSDTSRSVNFIPTEYVDITEEMERKEAMLACHESQLKWLLDHDGIDIIAVQRARAADRGSQCKAKYAEAFNQLLASQRLRTYRCLP